MGAEDDLTVHKVGRKSTGFEDYVSNFRNKLDNDKDERFKYLLTGALSGTHNGANYLGGSIMTHVKNLHGGGIETQGTSRT